MKTWLRRMKWLADPQGRDAELQDELQFHLDEEIDERRASGLTEEQARMAAHRDLGNVTLVRETTRTLWTWTLLEQLVQDVRFALRTMRKNRGFTTLVALSLALGIGANTAIYSFMDAILLRSLPVTDPASLVVMNWQSRPWLRGKAADGLGPQFVMHSGSGHTYDDPVGTTAGIFPFPAFELLQQSADPVLSSLFAYYPVGRVNLMIEGKRRSRTANTCRVISFVGSPSGRRPAGSSPLRMIERALRWSLSSAWV